ncbi:MAG: TIGR04283 family arsenosugar biosynthesis glycosyltransferase [Deltaproteobacteria bacterium]|nr:TIGR04283 family arsenosugar biosynthesis glycosyltransferase [Deltaproteobacteria bacterium]
MNLPYQTFSIIIPVLDEAATINQVLTQARRVMAGHPAEIIVVDGSPGGDTIRVIHVPQVKTIIAPCGRANQMNAGAREATGDILIFLHADTQLPDQAPGHIARVMHQQKYVAGAFDLGLDSNRPGLSLIRLVGSLRSRLTRIPYGDQAIFIRRDYFCSIGGFSPIPLMEDVALMRRIKRRGHKICILPDRVKTSSRRWAKEGLVYTTLRNWSLRILYFFGTSPDLLVKQYRNHSQPGQPRYAALARFFFGTLWERARERWRW